MWGSVIKALPICDEHMKVLMRCRDTDITLGLDTDCVSEQDLIAS